MDIATLGIKVESRDVPRATGELDRFTRGAGQAERGTTQLSRGGQALAGTMRTAAAGIAAAATAALSFQQAFRSAESYTRMTNGLRVLGMSGTEAAATLDQIAAVANRTRSPLESVAQLYQRISIAGQDLGASQSQVLTFTENVGMALAQSGTSAQEASGALLQLSQAMSGGIVRAEEFNSILEGAFPIAQAAARGIEGAAGSVGRLRQMIVDGEVTSSQFFNAILSQTAELEAAFANTVPTIGQAFTVLGNNFTTLIGQLDSTLGVSSAVAQSLIAISENLDRVAVYAGVAAVAIGVRYAGAMALAAARTVTLAGALTTLRAALIRTGFGAVIVLGGELAYQFTELARRAGGLGNAFGLLGEVAMEVWRGIVDSAAAIPPALSGVWQQIKSDFLLAVADISWAWARLLTQLANSAESLSGVSLFGESLFGGVASSIRETANNAMSASNDILETSNAAGNAARDSFVGAGAAIEGAFEGARGAVARLNAEIEGGTPGAGPDPMGAIPAAAVAEAAGGSSGGKSGRAGGASAAAAREAEKARREVQSLMEQMRRDFESAAESGADAMSTMFGSIVSGASSAKDAVGQLIQQIAGSMLSRAFSGLAMSGTDGGFFAGIGSLMGRAAGGPVRAGTPYMVNENTPRSEIMVPSQSGGVLNVPQAQAALRDSAGSGEPQKLDLRITMDPSTGALGAIATDRAGQVVTQHAPGIVRQSTRATQRAMQKSKRGWGI